MRIVVAPKYYPPLEEKLNIISHGVGLVLSVVALVFLVARATDIGNVLHIICFTVFGTSLIIQYAASILFHSSKKMKLRYRLNIFDHSAIYVLIAGTYTPFALITLQGTMGWIIFGMVWGFAVVGVIWKFMHIGKYAIVSTVMYVLMGWTIIIAINPLINNLSYQGLFWLFLGVFSYMIGAVFFSVNRMKFNHAIFHKLVLIGSFCHFMSIYYYVLPVK